MATDVEIDDSLYSRQRYVLGDGAMQRMSKAAVLLYGVGGLGIEIAKDIVLAGIKSLTIQDPKVCSIEDLGTQFFLREEDVTQGRNRATACSGKLAELNPYVSLKTLTTGLDDSTDLSYLTQYQCVILTEVPMNLQIKINKFCREQSPQIKFVSADVFGLFCFAFCDFGDQFEVVDPSGEEPKEVFIASVTKANPGVVTSLDNRMHGFETGDIVTFKEVTGMTQLNGQQFKIDVMSPYAFSICDTSGPEFSPYESEGIVSQVKLSKIMKFEPLETQILKPEALVADFSKFEMPGNTHLGMLALHKFKEENGRLPNVWCRTDAGRIVSLAKEINQQMIEKVDPICEDIIELLSFTCRGCFVPLCCALGGIMAQEALKAITGKFTPLNQWLYLDAIDVLSQEDKKSDQLFQARGDRYDTQRICVGENCIQKLANLKLFMVGCGAIGCEMMKNYALLGIGTQGEGCVTITDNDLIEKSNLNRQFLFHAQHIRKPKSTTAAESILQINKDMKITPQQNKVCPQTEETIYHDAFFESQNLIVNALDNVEARRYVDSRCVTNQRALLESGTMGTKGHTQVIVPFLTESYGSQRDPPDEEVPYCTLKSFPATIEHCIQWARDKFESSFTQKPNMFNKFWSTHSNPGDVIQKLESSEPLEGGVQSSKLLKNRPYDWPSCVRIGRLKFEKYFNHRAKNLLNAFPLDTRMSDGNLFWQSPKRPPKPVEFDPNNETHMLFVTSTARLYADISGVMWTPQDLTHDAMVAALATVDVPPFVPSSKRIETEESAEKKEEEDISGDELVTAAGQIKSTLQNTDAKQALCNMTVAEFEKDDDSNGHIDFITTAANLRATMYHIDNADRLKIKKIAGRIVPAIATTTSAVAGLITVELVKVVKQMPLESYRNCFLNLALPVMLLSEPGPCERATIREGVTVTNWDRWEVLGNKAFTLQQFLDYFKEKYGLEVNMVGHGVKMVFVPFMPGHMNRLPKTMLSLLKPGDGHKYFDLVVSLEDSNGEDVPGPPVRYHFGL